MLTVTAQLGAAGCGWSGWRGQDASEHDVLMRGEEGAQRFAFHGKVSAQRQARESVDARPDGNGDWLGRSGPDHAGCLTFGDAIDENAKRGRRLHLRTFVESLKAEGLTVD